MQKLVLIIVLVVFQNILLPQEYSIIKNSNQFGIELSLTFPAADMDVLDKDGIRTAVFQLSMDESNPGSPILPSSIVYLVIPPNSEIDINVDNKSVSEIKNIYLEGNPAIVATSDSTVKYVSKEIEYSFFASEEYPKTEYQILGYNWIRDYYTAAIKINTHRYNWKNKNLSILNSIDLRIRYKDVKPFQVNNQPKGEFDNSLRDIIVNYSQAEQFRSYAPIKSNSSDDWIDYSKEYIKLGLLADGIYKITYNDFIAYGVNPAQVNPKTIKLFNKGKEIPIIVNGESDNIFDPTDNIEFWMTKNYNLSDYKQIVPIGSDYINYMDRYTDSSFVWITWGGNPGERIPIQIGNSVVANDTLDVHNVKVHLETDVRLWYYDNVTPRIQFPQWQENKTFTWNTIGGSGTLSHTISLNSFVPNKIVKTTVRLLSYASNIQNSSHKIGSSLNSATYQDTIVYNYKQIVNFNSSFPSNSLINGNNIFRLFGRPTSATVNNSLVDWIDFEFLRYNAASNDSLMITVPDSVQSSLKIIKITNIVSPDSNLIILKVSPNLKRVVNFNRTGSTITFNDTVKGGEKYVVLKKAFQRTPKFYKKKSFINLRNSNRGADYVLITNRVLQSSATNYQTFINNNYGVRTQLIYVDDIYDEFNYGYLSAESIKDFLANTFINWIAPKPSYLLLVGDSNYDYKDIITPAPAVRKKNLVPSYGMPVSDVWYVTLDTLNINIPQMYVGRIPANNDEELNRYLTKHQNYLTKRYDAWNKTAMFFSGGDPSNISELAQIKAANDSVFNTLHKSFPNGGNGYHFYKTTNPFSNFGPFTQVQVQEAIDTGAIYISYLGHSGTQTWDNGITQVNDLRSIFGNRHPLITDFGCSTGRYAEPDVDAFSESFISLSPYGQAIAYIGNSCFGYTSTSLRFPYLFYGYFLKDTVRSMGQTHILAKLKQFNVSGVNDVNRVFNYCNLFFGDPIVKLSIPSKPNFSISPKDISLLVTTPNDLLDSIPVELTLNNLGKAITDSVAIFVTDKYEDTLVYQKEFKVPVPLFSDKVIIKIPVKKRTGSHQLEITIDKDNLIDELYKDDNYAKQNYSVFATSLKMIEPDNFYLTARKKVKLLNPILPNNESVNSISVEIADNPSFINSQLVNKSVDTLFTEVELPVQIDNKRYWWRAKLNAQEVNWSEVSSFKSIDVPSDWMIDKDFKMNQILRNDVSFDSALNKWSLIDKTTKLKIISAGANVGSYASMQYNGDEQLSNTYFWGIATAILDSLTLEPTFIKYFYYPNPPSGDSLKAYIESLPTGTLLAVAICDDGAQSVLGYSGGTPVRNAIKTLGSYYIDSVRYRESWCILGKKDAPIGSVPEAYTKLFAGPAIIELTKEVTIDSGFVIFPVIKNSSSWVSVTKDDSIIAGTSINYFPIGRKQNNQSDTLSQLQFVNNIASISGIDANEYPEIQLLAKFKANSNKQSPLLSSLGVDFNSLPELALNYQTVSINSDTIMQGESLGLNFSFSNLGYVPSKPFNASVYVKKPNNSHIKILDTNITSLDNNKKIILSTKYKSMIEDGFGNMSFKIFVDSMNSVREFHKDNNFFEKTFVVKKDTTPPTPVNYAIINAIFDKSEIVNGDLVSPNPEIQFIINYNGNFPIADTGAVNYYLDNHRIYYTMMDNIIYDTANKKLLMTYKPSLTNGEHLLRATGKDVSGPDNKEFELFFNVISELKVLQAYNYPNPMKESTSFTLNLSQIPEELTLRIFTISGRLIKEIKRTAPELKIGFNSITWDGKDEDGDLPANGVYLYKIIAKKDSKIVTVTEKLAIVK